VLASSVATSSFIAHQSMLDASAPAGGLYYWKSHYLPALTDAAIEAIADHAWRFASPRSFTLLSQMGGAIRRLSDGETAFTGRDAEFTININCAATARASFEADVRWVRNWFDVLTPHSTGGVYVNFMGDEGRERVLAAYGAEKYRRLAAMKARYDPGNAFRSNQNIAPDRQAAPSDPIHNSPNLAG
jgi:FAD/FMN-containing dehydrogenase